MAKLRIPLQQKINSRTASLSKDSYAANCYFEGKDVFKRPGYVNWPISSGDSITPGQAQGMTVFNGNLYCIVNNNLFKITPYGVSKKLGTLLASSTGGGAVDTKPVDGVAINSGYGTTLFPFFFTQTANGSYLFFHDASHAYYLSSGSDTINSVSTNLTSFASGVAYLDGYICVLGTNARVYNSNADDATTWGALNFLTAQSDPDAGVAIVRQLNYIVVFGEWSTEFFYDAANATGSPLSVQQSLKLEIGCADGNSVAKFDQSVFWVGKSKLHGRAVYMLDNGTAPACISTPAIERYLNAYPSSYIYSYCFRIEGHVFYLVSIKDAGITFVFDLNQKEWYTWTSYTGSTEMIFNLGFYTEFNGSYFALGLTDGKIYQLSVNNYSDDVQPIYFRVVTDNIDHGNSNRKFYRHVEIIGDKVNANAVLNHTNNDFVSFSNGRTINLKNKRAQLFNLGESRRRAWQLLITDNQPIRLESIELEFDIGGLEEGQ